MKGKRKPRKRKPDVLHDLPAAVEEDSYEEPSFRLRGVTFTLALLVAICFAVTLVFPDLPVVDRFGANLATEALGILLTLVFVQRFFERQERARRLRGSIGALRKGSRALTDLAWTWAELLRSCLRRPPSTPPRSLRDLFVSHFTEDLSYYDPHAERVEADGSSMPQLRWASRRFLAAQEALSEIIVTYGGSLDPAYVEVIDELVDDAFLRLVRQLSQDGSIDAREWRLRLNAARAHREAHFERLMRAVRIQNDIAAEAAKLRSPRTAPRTGSVGLKLPLDHDLKVHLEMDSRWW